MIHLKMRFLQALQALLVPQAPPVLQAHPNLRNLRINPNPVHALVDFFYLLNFIMFLKYIKIKSLGGSLLLSLLLLLNKLCHLLLYHHINLF